MLMDCTMMGPDRRFELEVPSIAGAAEFYSVALGGHEVFRETSPSGETTRLGMNIGTVGIVLVSALNAQTHASMNRMTLIQLAAELETPFIGLLVCVDDPAESERRALDAGAQRHPDATAALPTYGNQAVRVIVDPFGTVWALAAA